MSGGLGAGDLLSIVGRPGMGKTYLMMHGANHAWLSGHTPLFISMEMKPLLVMQRAAAMLARLPITGIKHAALETHQQAKLQNYLIKNKQAKVPYWIVDGALTATVDDILLLAAQLNPSAVFIDGAYLLRTKQRMPRWEKLTENAERIKGEIAEGLGVPTVISYQLNRESKKKGKGEPVGLEHIAYTDAIGQLSSIVLAQTEEESVETLIRKRVEIAKGRSGEQGHFNINWKFDQGPDYMNFDEILPPPKEEEQQDLGHI
jgi:replicative DNA helicase